MSMLQLIQKYNFHSPRWGQDSVEGFDQALSISVTVLSLDLPSLEPGHLLRDLKHVVSVPSGDGDESDSSWIVSDLLDVVADFLLNFLESSLRVWWFSRVHLVDSDNQLLHTQGVGQESVLSGLTVLGDTSLELSGTSSDDQDSAISLES
jgi:hypothetical protein